MYSACITIDDSTKQSLDRIGYKGEVFIVTNEVKQVENTTPKLVKPDFDILPIGRIYFKQKGQDEAIEFLEDYSEALNVLKVIIAGSGVDEDRLTRMLDNRYLTNEYTLDSVRTLLILERARVILMASKIRS